MSELKTFDYDVVIIGSGAGGGTVAKELSRRIRGAKIGLLEWGGRFSAKDNTRRELEMAHKYYFDDGGFQTRSKDLTLAFAKAVGGSTTVYTGTTLKATSHVFEEWNVPGLSMEDLDPRYEKYIKENSVHLVSEGELNRNNHLFMEGCRSLGWEAKQFPVNTKGCQGLGTCNLGCGVLAKQGTAAVQIPEAEKNGVELIPFCRAECVIEADETGYGAVLATVLPPSHGLAASPLDPGTYRFRAKKIVLSAGSIYSVTLLLKSIGNSGRRRLPALGRYFTCHPALILSAQSEEPVNISEGHPKSFYCDRFAATDRFLLETCTYFPFTFAKSMVGFGKEPDELISRFDYLQMILALALDRPLPENRIEVGRDGNPVVHYRFTREVLRSFVSSARASARIFFASGAKKVHVPGTKSFFIPSARKEKLDELISEDLFKVGQATISAAHLMGGCRMGSDPRTSVTDAWGRVHGMRNLYVADASLFPACSEVNPYLTVMALADRVAEGLARDFEKGEV